MKNKDTQQLATLVYVLAMRKEIEKEVESRYTKRIDYLVGANNELMAALEVCESESITVEKDDGSIDFTASEEFRTRGGAIGDGDGITGTIVTAEKKRES